MCWSLTLYKRVSAVKCFVGCGSRWGRVQHSKWYPGIGTAERTSYLLCFILAEAMQVPQASGATRIRLHGLVYSSGQTTLPYAEVINVGSSWVHGAYTRGCWSICLEEGNLGP